MKILTSLVGVFAACAMLSGCGQVEAAIDCQGICDRYKSCYDSSYDTSHCADRCRDNAKADQDYQRKADACNDCIGNKSCAAATFNCATECAGIVP